MKLVVALLLIAASVQAQGLGRALGNPRARPRSRPAAATLWPGPQIQLGYQYWRLDDGWGGGDVHAANVGVFLQWPEQHVRSAIWAELGSRDYSLGSQDLLGRGWIEIGAQFPELDPLLLHVSALGTLGGLVGQRFETTVAYGLGGVGFEAGAELHIFRSFHAGLDFGYLRLSMNGVSFHAFFLRLTLGL
jgi:hypothetical protein